jgi:uncharacterized protein YwgA
MSNEGIRLRERFDRVAQIVRDAGGEIVGRTRLQKTAYLLSVAGFEDAFRFGYKYYGPYSESLSDSAELAAAFDRISESQQQAGWGGTYSVYRSEHGPLSSDGRRVALAQEAARSDAILLELAATAAYLAREGRTRPWTETERRKPDKAADGRLHRAKDLYARLRVASGNALPEIGAQ